MARVRKEQKRRRGRSPNRSRTREQANERASRGSGALAKLKGDLKFYKTSDKTHKIDVLPYIVSQKNPAGIPIGDLWYERVYYMHSQIGPEGIAVLCPAKNWGHPCPICEEKRRMEMDPNADEKAIKALKPKERALYNIEENGERFVWDISTFFFTQDLEEELRESNEKFDGFWDVVDRATLSIRFGPHLYDGRTSFRAKKIDFIESDDLVDGIENETQDLDVLLVEMPYEQLTKLFLGMEIPSIRPEESTSSVQNRTHRPRVPKEEEQKDDLNYGSKKEPEPDDEEGVSEIPEGFELCPDCEGSGKNSRGTRKCSECRGKGYIEVEIPPESNGGDEDNDVPFDPNNPKCPHGHIWGVDCEDKDECDACDMWDDCMDAKEAIEKEESKA